MTETIPKGTIISNTFHMVIIPVCKYEKHGYAVGKE